MHFEFSFYSSLLLIFFLHGLVYAILGSRKLIVVQVTANPATSRAADRFDKTL